MCFHLPEVQKTFNVYYPTEAYRGGKVQLLINPDDCNDNANEFYSSIYNLEWIEGKAGLFEQEIKPRLEEWIKKRLNKLEEKQLSR